MIFIALLALAGASIDGHAGTDKIGLLVAEAQANAILADLQAQTGDWKKATDSALSAKGDIDKRTDAALMEANGHPDLLRALKEYIVAANSYFDAVGEAQARRLKTDMDAKAKMVELELKTIPATGK
jgi:hypothetical protein